MAEDSGLDGKKESKAMMLAFWDKIEKARCALIYGQLK